MTTSQPAFEDDRRVRVRHADGTVTDLGQIVRTDLVTEPSPLDGCMTVVQRTSFTIPVTVRNGETLEIT